jgi:hypothetical protein
MQTKQIPGEFEGLILTVPKYDGHVLLERSIDNKPLSREEGLMAFSKKHVAIIQMFIKSMYTYD